MDDDNHDRHFPPPPSSPLSLSYTNWAFFSHGQGGEEEVEWREEGDDKVKQALLYATLELESTRVAAHDQIHRMECELARLRDLLLAATRERDEARHQVHHALLLLHNNNGAPAVTTPRPPPTAGALLPSPAPAENTNTHGPNSAGVGVGVSPSSSSLSSEGSSVIVSPSPRVPPAGEEVELFELVPVVGKLPEKGRLLEAVVKAGPLLQNLMLAGPLPQWRHPPPPLRSFDIPPVSIGAGAAAEDTKPTLAHHHSLLGSKKRGMDEAACGQSPPSSFSSSPKISSGSNTRSSCKYQKIGPFLRY
uniref:Membralin n=1 Tax=Anthurium amnicola TaxID=1678845 RepID=A0A1D1YF17_9ARAE